ASLPAALSLAVRVQFIRERSAALPEHAQEHPNARRDQQRLDRFLLHVFFEAALPFGGALAAFLVILARLVPELVVFLGGDVSNLRPDISNVLRDLLCAVTKLLTGALRLLRLSGGITDTGHGNSFRSP